MNKMQTIEFTINLKDLGECFCVVDYHGIEREELHSEYGRHWITQRPHVDFLELKSIEPMTSPDTPPSLTGPMAKQICEYAENLILAGENL